MKRILRSLRKEY